MTKKDINFSANQFILTIDGVSDGLITTDSFKDISLDDLETRVVTRRETGDKETLEVKKITKTEYYDRFIGIYEWEGKKYPYSPTIVDETHTEKTNPRNPEQIEFNSQFFALIDTQSRRIYISDQRKKNAICVWLSDKLKNEVSVKAILDEAEFVENIKKIQSITIAAVPDLFNSNIGASLSSHIVQDIYAFDAVRASLKFDYNLKVPTVRLREKLSEIIRQKSDYNQITVIGRDDGGMENILNLDGITSNIKLEIGVDENEVFPDPGLVFEELIVKIRQHEQ
jgi:hypothetical protein